MTCPQCGAAIKQGDGRFCSHCGTSLPDRPRIAPDEWTTHPERFEEAEASPQHGTAMGLPAPAPSLGATVIAPAVFLVIWCAVGVTMIGGFARVSGAMVLFPIAMLTFGVVGIGGMIKKNVAKARADVIRVTAVVVDERTDVSSSGSGDDRSTSTSYYATLQMKDGTRTELPTTGALAGFITRGDIGVAVTRGGDLVDFHRIRL